MIALIWQFLSGRLLKAIGDLLSFITRNPLPFACITLACLFVWAYRGWVLEESAHNRTKAVLHAKVKASAVQAKRIDALAVSISTDIKTIQQEYKHEIGNIARQRDDALERLRNRPERPPKYTPTDPAFATVCTGARLARDDAEFLTRYAADAAEQASALKSCEAAYETVRKKIDDFNAQSAVAGGVE